MDVIKTADYIIDLGPEGGFRGGTIVFKGTPDEMINNSESITGEFLKKELVNDFPSGNLKGKKSLNLR